MTLQSEARLIAQGTRAPSLEIVNGHCRACQGNVVIEPVQGQSRAWTRLRAICLSCGLDTERPLSTPRPLPTAADMAPQQRGRPRKGRGLGPGGGTAA